MSQPIVLSTEELSTLAYIDQSESPTKPGMKIGVGCQVVAYAFAAGYTAQLRLAGEVVSVGETHLQCRAIEPSQDSFGYPAGIQRVRFAGETSVPLCALTDAHAPQAGDANCRAYLLQNIPSLDESMLDRLADIAGTVPCEGDRDSGRFIDDETGDEDDDSLAARRFGVWLLVGGLTHRARDNVFTIGLDHVERDFQAANTLEVLFPNQSGMVSHLDRYYEHDSCDYRVVIASCDEFAVKLTNWLEDYCDNGSDAHMDIEIAVVDADARQGLIDLWCEMEANAIVNQMAKAVSRFNPKMTELVAEKVTELFGKLHPNEGSPVSEPESESGQEQGLTPAFEAIPA